MITIVDGIANLCRRIKALTKNVYLFILYILLVVIDLGESDGFAGCLMYLIEIGSTGVGFYSLARTLSFPRSGSSAETQVLAEIAIITDFNRLTKVRYLILIWSFFALLPDLTVTITLVWFLASPINSSGKDAV